MFTEDHMRRLVDMEVREREFDRKFDKTFNLVQKIGCMGLLLSALFWLAVIALIVKIITVL